MVDGNYKIVLDLLERAWDEGYRCGLYDGSAILQDSGYKPPGNPYRREREEGDSAT